MESASHGSPLSRTGTIFGRDSATPLISTRSSLIGVASAVSPSTTIDTSNEVPPTWLVLVLFWWLVFRLEFGAGMIKMRGDRCWRDLTCLAYHHETQPMPNPLSWYFHRLSPRLHKVETLANHVTQLVVVFGLLLPQPIAGVAAAVMVITQGYLMISGNFAWLNALTLVLALAVLDGRWLAAVLPVEPPDELVDQGQATPEAVTVARMEQGLGDPRPIGSILVEHGAATPAAVASSSPSRSSAVSA